MLNRFSVSNIASERVFIDIKIRYHLKNEPHYSFYSENYAYILSKIYSSFYIKLKRTWDCTWIKFIEI